MFPTAAYWNKMTLRVLCFSLLYLCDNDGLLVSATDPDLLEEHHFANRELEFLKNTRQRAEALINWPNGSPPTEYDLEKLRFPPPATVPKNSQVDWLGKEIERLSNLEITPEEVDSLNNKATEFQRMVNEKRLKNTLFTFSENPAHQDTSFAMAPSDANFYNMNFNRNEIPEHPILNKKPKVRPVISATQDPSNVFEDLRRHRQNPQGNLRLKSIVNTPGEGSSLGGQDEPQPKPRQFHVIQRQTSNESLYLVAIVAGAAATITVCVVGVVVGWYKLHKRSKAAADVDYPAYGVTGPIPDLSPDRRLAQSAQMYHYQHQKQQIVAMDIKTSGQRNGSISEPESEEENEEGDYTVYECPGFATTGEMEVKNPLFSDEPTPGKPPQTPPPTAEDAAKKPTAK